MSARPSLREALIEMLAVHSAESDAQKGTQDWCERAARAESLAWQALMSSSTVTATFVGVEPVNVAITEA